MIMEERTQEEIEWYMERFTGLVQKCQDEHQRSSKFPKETTVRVEKGRKYWKIMIDAHDERWREPMRGQRSTIFGFVRREDGAIFRAANLKAPETRTKCPIRGYIWEEDAGSTFSWTGINYDSRGLGQNYDMGT
jgi:hypothetical protein